MTSPEPTSLSLLAKGVEAGIKTADSLLLKLLGPAADEIGQILQDKVRAYRAKNLTNVLHKTQDKILTSGQSVSAVPTKLLLPLIEGASLEDDDDLSEKWAGLLASAAAIDSQRSFHPSFPKILSEMTALEAILLDQLNGLGGETPWLAFRAASAASLGCTEDTIREAHGNLQRLGLWHNIRRAGAKEANLTQISPFGKAFVTAASGPIARA